MLGTDAITQHVFCAKAVLQRHHRSVGANKPASLFHGLGGIERLAQNDDQVARPNAIWRGMTRKPYGFLSCRRYHNQAIFIDGIHVRSAPHEINLIASFRQRTADGASQRASPQNANLHCFPLVKQFQYPSTGAAKHCAKAIQQP